MISNLIKNYFFNLCCLLCFNSFLFAQRPYLKQFTVEDGLPSSNVYTAFQDKDGLMWFGTDNGITRFDGYTFESFNMSAINASTDIWGIHEDSKNRLWFSSERQLSYYEKGEFKAIPFPKKQETRKITQQFLGKKGDHYVHFNNTKEYYSIEHKETSSYMKELSWLSNLNPNFEHLFLKRTDDNKLWFINKRGSTVFLLQYKNKRIIDSTSIEISSEEVMPHYSLIKLENDKFILINRKEYLLIDLTTRLLSIQSFNFTIDFEIKNYAPVTNNLILLKTNKGYKLLDRTLNLVEGFDFLNRFFINSLYEDKQGNIWICTNNEGIYFLPKFARKSKTLPTEDIPIKDEITALTLDAKGQVWFTNKNLELKVLQKNGNIKTIQFEIKNGIKKVVYFDDLSFDENGNLIIGGNEEIFVKIPMDILNRKKHFIIEYKKPGGVFTYSNEEPVFLGTNVIKSISKPYGGKQYITTDVKLYEISNNEKNQFELKAINKGTAYTSAVWQDTLWIGRKNNLYKMPLTHNSNGKSYPVRAFPFPINALNVSLDDKLWIGTGGNGLFRLSNNKIDTIAEFFDTRITIKSLYIDHKNQLWISTNKGLALIKILKNQPFNYEYKILTKADGLISDEINDVVIEGEQIYIATSRGLTILNEEDLSIETIQAPLFFTNLNVNAKKTNFEEEVILPYHQNNIRIDYLCLSYSNMGNIQYEYLMEGIDKKWETTVTTFKEYPTLPPNTYTFKIRAKNLNGIITTEKTLNIVILSPWWQTWTAWFGFCLLALLLSYSIFKYQLNRTKERHEKEQLEALTTMKNRFYANITHEFRTPLTLILGITQQLKERKIAPTNNNYVIIERNSNRLLQLINQLLDLNKLEANAMPLHFQYGDIIVFIKYQINLFKLAAQEKNIQLTFYQEIETLEMDFDPSKIQSILFNLISNALVHTPENGEIIVHLTTDKERKELILKVKDNGKGISKEAINYIFNRFYQVGEEQEKINSTGIGLALVKELIELLKGTIQVSSSKNGTTFTIHLPIMEVRKGKTPNHVYSHYVNYDLSKSINPSTIKNVYPLTPSNLITEHKSTLLLVEDDLDLLHYLQQVVGNYYHIITAKDGREGIKKAKETVPSLIISDVMMPHQNGFELCTTLKADEKTSHIPIILLTAKASAAARLQGLQKGADAYLTKPFDQMELMVRIEQLLKIRLKLQERYQAVVMPSSKMIDAKFPKEDEFILKLKQLIETNLDNTELDITFLCKKLLMSRTQLHNKITYLTGASTTKYIRKIRLEKAEYLLKNTNSNISEIAYEVGFDVKYFSKVFSKTYGASPSNYRKQLQL